MIGKIQTKIKREKKCYPKLVFYSHAPWIFRTTLIGYLYEIAQDYPVVLLSEELDSETEEILHKREFFPKLEEIIPVRQFTGKKMNLLNKNRYLRNIAKEVVQLYKPNIVISTTDTYPFDLYLMRSAKRVGAITISLESMTHSVNLNEVSLITDMTNAYFRLPSFLPFRLRLLLIRLRKYLGYILYNWVIPLMIGELPFLGTSIVLYSPTGLRADYHIALSKRDYDLSIREGVPAEKLYILSHPLMRKDTKKIFERAYFLNARQKFKTNIKTLTFLYPYLKIGFKRNDLSIISEEEIQKNVMKIINPITKILKGWKIFIKPHPNDQIPEELKKTFKSISSQIEITEPSDPVDRYIEISDVVVASDEVTTAIFTASLQCPEKIILVLDFRDRLGGDFYKNFPGVEYISSEEQFINILELIRDNKYSKQQPQNKIEPLSREFSNTSEILTFLLQKNETC